MRRNVQRLMAGGIAVATVGAMAGAFGCSPFYYLDDCEKLESCPPSFYGVSGSGGGDGGTPAGCIPSENDQTVADTCGVFVSSSAGKDANEGTQARPVATLAKAVEKAASTGKPVYACAEEFTEAVLVPAGVTIFGGLGCDEGWAYVGGKTRTTIRGGADELVLVLMGGEATTRIEDVRVVAVDATVAGGSSIAVLADGGNVELARCELAAGNGAHGTDGADGDPNGMPATAGVAGSAGENACSDLDGTPGPDAKLLGGDQVTNDCGNDELSIGGSGGNGNVTNGGGGDTGQTGSAGQGGIGEPAVGMWDCIPGSGQGTSGSSGEVGIAGVGATGLGSLASSGFMGTSGSAGTVGRAGQGGGGGGGAKGGLICAGGVSGSGASGGSGGAGGCGGLPGQGGNPGGASIALVSLSASVTLTDCTLSSTKGGDGGAGGDAQAGGLGGDSGKGGLGVGLSKAACDGGKGGAGGNGGPGGGGLGGPSLGIAFQGEAPTRSGETMVTPGVPGAGGPGGSVNVAMNAGATGIAGEQQEFP